MPDSSRTPAGVDRPRAWANDRFKSRWRAALWGGILAATAFHGLLLGLSPLRIPIPPRLLPRVERLALTPPLDREPTRAPPPVRAPPIPAFVGGAGFEEIPRPPEPIFDRAPEPPIDGLLRELMDGPTFTPYAIAPELKNREDAVEALLRFYPVESADVPELARADVWFLIDQFGSVRKTLIKTSTGHPELDEAVLKAASIMEFTPAWAGERAVPVWISLPIVFQIDLEGAGAADTADVAEVGARRDGTGTRPAAGPVRR